MPRYKITVEYDGSPFFGWQAQENLPTVQGFLQQAIFKATGHEPEVFGAGRTDTGVHAVAQVAHFDSDKNWDPYRMASAINAHLAAAKVPISVLEASIAPDDFHARFSAKYRSYKYVVINRRSPLVLWKSRAYLYKYSLDVAAMQRATGVFIGRRDFSSFRASECQSASAIKTIDDFTITQTGEQIVFQVKAKSFLHHQVRNMVGSLVEVGRGKIDGFTLQKILDAKDRRKAGPTAPACGLYLFQVDY
ncbi:MAG: tRNA pseudouridine(38-40) synthase TruA [Alphaproteobacteria bacterium]|nr:tRNA pseudouridine(38-40) synthase TruA [Alphaproteobacteria bacterium]